MTRHSILPSFKALRRAGQRPRLHGNGFIQLDLDSTRRLHVWHPRTQRAQSVYTPIHDHVFDMRSDVLHGGVVNVVYRAKMNPREGAYELWGCEPAEGSNTILRKMRNMRCDLEEVMRLVVVPGSRYTHEAGVFHTTEPLHAVAVTVMTKINTLPTVQPRVAVPFDTEPDNTHDRHAANEDVLWRLIEHAAYGLRR